MRMRFVSLFVHDEEKALDFWTNKMGFELVVDNPTPFGGRFLMFSPPGGGAKIVVSRPVPGTDAKVGGFTNIAWESDDVEATYEALRAKGVEFTKPPARTFWGGMEAVFVDPDGNSFLLQQGGLD
jgi:lactoylglutathione lyase